MNVLKRAFQSGFQKEAQNAGGASPSYNPDMTNFQGLEKDLQNTLNSIKDGMLDGQAFELPDAPKIPDIDFDFPVD